MAGTDHQSSLLPPTGHHRSPSLSPLLALFKRKGCARDAQVGEEKEVGAKIHADPGAGSSAGWWMEETEKHTHKVEASH